VKAALQSVPGVRTAEVDFNQKEAAVTADKKGFDANALIAALKQPVTTPP